MSVLFQRGRRAIPDRDLSYNKLFALPRTLLAATPALNRFLVNHNRIHTLPHNFFARNEGLYQVYVCCGDDVFAPYARR